MQKGICEKCGENKWINKHHIYPKKYFGINGNKEMVKLCLDCHADIHELLPKEEKEKSFYKEFTLKFISGLMLLLITLYLIL